MAKSYQMLYKCRLCGQVFVNYGTVSEKVADVLYCESISDELSDLGNLPTIDPKTLRPVAHWEEIPGSYEVCAGESGSWSVPATRCANPECGEENPCGLKTPFCPMCGFRMEDVPYDG